MDDENPLQTILIDQILKTIIYSYPGTSRMLSERSVVRDNTNSFTHTDILHQRCLSHYVFMLYIQQIKFILKKEENL
jgi:hypothetical protein